MAEPLTMTRLPEPIVVLGGGGFIGSNLVRRLVADGYDEVHAVDVAWPSFREDALDGAFCRTIDLRRASGARDAIRGAGTVFHLVADMGGVGYFHSDADLGAAIDNGRMTANVLEACARYEVERVFVASSACAYPVELQRVAARALPLEETWAGHGTPDQLYGAEKLQALRLASKVPGARVGILHTVYGLLQEHEGRRMKFPAAVATKAIAARRTGTLELWGKGDQLRSYAYVDDAVEMILRVMCADGYDGPVNIGAEGAVSCRNVAEMCLLLAGVPDARITTNPAEPSGVLARDCSLAKFAGLYGPAPQRSYASGFGAFIAWLDEIGVNP